jgi:hypothetical protein
LDSTPVWAISPSPSDRFFSAGIDARVIMYWGWERLRGGEEKTLAS